MTAARKLSLGESVLRLRLFTDADQALKDKVHALLLANCETDEDTDCMIYTGAWTERGVGRIRVGQTVYNIQRVGAWLYRAGFELFDGRCPYHKCRNPACFNPDHIEVAPTKKAAFAAMRGLGVFGGYVKTTGRRPGPRLSFAKAESVRARFAEGATVEQLALEHDVGAEDIRKVLAGETWVREDATHRPSATAAQAAPQRFLRAA